VSKIKIVRRGEAKLGNASEASGAGERSERFANTGGYLNESPVSKIKPAWSERSAV